jgi:hypothetical protein
MTGFASKVTLSSHRKGFLVRVVSCLVDRCFCPGESDDPRNTRNNTKLVTTEIYF